jgi:hypothetical protein
MSLSSARTAVASPGQGRLRPPLLPGPPGRTRELMAALAVVAFLVHLLFAQVTLVLAIMLLVTGRTGRWRPLWLAVPAAAGAAWIAAVGAGRAIAGFAAGPRQVAGFFAGVIGHPGRLGQAGAAFAGAGHWLPRQFPVALALAAAEAAAVGYALRAQAGEPPDYRPGLLVAVRRRRAVAALAAGVVVTRDGTDVGLDDSSGRRAEISWAQAAGGVLAVSADPQGAARVSFPVAACAVRRRMTVIVVDLTGSAWLADSLSGVCAAAAAPLRRFSPAGPAWYEPFRSHPPPRAAALAIKMISWAGTTERQRQAGQRYLADALAVLAARPVPLAVLDALVTLLEPARLREAMAAVPGHLPSREALALRVAGSAAALEADPALGHALAGQLQRLRASGPGRWLRAPAAGLSAAAPPRPLPRPLLGPDRGDGRKSWAPPVIRLGQAVRERSCVLFSLGLGGEATAMAGRLAVADLTTVLSGLRDQGLHGDVLAWVHGCEAVDRPSLAALLGLGPATGTAVLLSTASPAAAASLAPAAGLVVSSGPVDPVLAGRLAGLAPFREEGGQQAAAEALRGQDEDEFALITRGSRFRPDCRSVPAAWARLR